MTLKLSLVALVHFRIASVVIKTHDLFLNIILEGPTSCIHGDVRLQDGTDDSNGRVEICQERRWIRVCIDGWDVDHTRAVCNQLNYNAEGIGTL